MVSERGRPREVENTCGVPPKFDDDDFSCAWAFAKEEMDGQREKTEQQTQIRLDDIYSQLDVAQVELLQAKYNKTYAKVQTRQRR